MASDFTYTAGLGAADGDVTMKFAPFEKFIAFAVRGNQQHRLTAFVVAVLGGAFLTVAILSYAVSHDRLRDLIVTRELPLMSDTVYSNIQRDFSKPLEASAQMARNTFLVDWASSGEKDVAVVQKYLTEMQRLNSAFTAYFVSANTHRYYTPNGVLKAMSPSDPHDVWFFKLGESEKTYDVEIDTDQNHDNALTMFINYRVFNDKDEYLGVIGLGLQVDSVQAALNQYQQKFDSKIDFIGRAGKVMMSGGKHAVFADIQSAPGLADLAPEILQGRTGAYSYEANSQTHLLNVRFMPEMDWYLLVERIEEAAVSGIRHTLYINLVIAGLATALVAVVLAAAMTYFHAALDKAATTDDLTGLINRRAFNIFFAQATKASRRARNRLSVVVFDIDQFRQINEKHGRRTGDKVLRSVAATVDARSRPSDIVCRWGDEEILLMLQDCSLDKAIGLADEIRKDISALTIIAGAKPVSVTVSAGAAEMSGNDTEETVLARAHEGLGAAQHEGRNRVISSSRF
jgi:diguanylate cyclase (GGDEF)-like protein